MQSRLFFLIHTSKSTMEQREDMPIMKRQSMLRTRLWMQQNMKGWKSWARVEVLLLLCIIFSIASLAAHATVASSGDWSTYLAGNGRDGFNAAETMITPA